MNVNCQRCGGPIPRQNGPGGRRKFCPACSPKRDRPNRRLEQTPARPTLTTTHPLKAGGVYEATLAEVQALGMADHYLGALALHVARMLDDSSSQAGGAVAALAKCHRETVNEMRAAAPKPQEESPLQRLRRENLERRASH